MDNSKQLLSKQATNWFRGIAAIMVVASHYAEWWNWFVPTEGNAEIIRLAISKLGVYGVDLFFLFSGYAMVKSLGNQTMNLTFIKKRIKNVYVPYFIIIGIIELISGGFTSAQDFWLFASGYEYWYMLILFIFYIGFIAIYTIIGSKEVRVIVMVIFTYILSDVLYDKGMYDFWYVSNITFALGVMIGEYEEPMKKVVDKIGGYAIVLLAFLMYFVVKSGLFPPVMEGPDEWLVWKQVGATMVWTLLVLFIAAKWKFYDKFMMLLGRNSLYIYLTHTFVFMRCVNNFRFSFGVRFAIAAVLTIIVSIVCKFLIAQLFKILSGKDRNRPYEAML